MYNKSFNWFILEESPFIKDYKDTISIKNGNYYTSVADEKAL